MRPAWAFIIALCLSVGWLSGFACSRDHSAGVAVADARVETVAELVAEQQKDLELAETNQYAWKLMYFRSPPHFTDKDEPDMARVARLGYISEAIQKAAGTDRYIAKALVVHARFETHFARYVGEGRCKDGPVGSRCDEGRARTYFQVWETTCPKAWSEPQGSVAELEAAAVCAARVLRSGRARCGTPEGMFAAMWGSGRCKLEKAAVRARAFEALP